MDPDSHFIPLFNFVLYVFLRLYYIFVLVMELENSCQPDCWLEEFMYPEIPAPSHVEYGCLPFLCLQSNAELLLTFCACFLTFRFFALKVLRFIFSNVTTYSL